MSDEEEDLGAMAWPGFVDILSSVIIMFVFFVMVVASALYFHIIIFKSKILSEVSESTSASAKLKELADTNRFLMEKIEEMEENAKVTEKPSDATDVQLYQIQTQFSESENQEVRLLQDEDGFLVFFGDDSISVTEENQTIISDFIQNYEKTHGADNVKVRIVASKNPNAVSDVISRQLAVSRMLNVRNLFLESDIQKEKIVPKIAAGDDVDGSYHWVRIIFEAE